MSRVGRQIINIPDKVKVEYNNNLVTVTGPLGSLSQNIASRHISVEIAGNILTVLRNREDKQTKAMHGLYRVLINNMVLGVVKPFSKSLIVNGVGYKTAVSGNKLVMNIGYSHPVEIVAPKGITITCTTPTEIKVEGISKEQVGAVAAKIKAAKPVEPYHLYGIRYSTEQLTKKEGKTAGK
ncbi:MAG: 50S ribosomal protein L6 [Firmicutes bacterium]|nr:50S ribosomal protein L6 [Bacillota bacterium]MCL1954189.1 50S ribosomal protein L6 [Bacillota bacterium]